MSQMSGAVSLFDQRRAETFAERIGDTVNAGAVTLMLAIGHRTGLFDTMATAAPGTSHQIADAAGLSERYVREWLAAMVTGGIVDFDPQGRTYHLPREHAESLTRTGSLGNLCVAALTIPMAGAAQERILACFETGAGTSYDDYPCFHQMMAEDSGQTVVAALFRHDPAPGAGPAGAARGRHRRARRRVRQRPGLARPCGALPEQPLHRLRSLGRRHRPCPPRRRAAKCAPGGPRHDRL